MEQFDYTKISVGYYDKVYQRQGGVQSRWHHQKFEFLRRYLPKTGKLLDIGCGPGTFIGTLSNTGLDCTGIDIAPDQIDYATNNYGHSKARFISISLDTFAENSSERFDVITFVEVLEHLPEDVAVNMLKRARSLLLPGGRILVTTPNYHSAWPFVEFLVNRIGEVKYEDQHINRYDAKKLGSHLKESGYDAGNMNSFMSFSPFVAALSWQLSRFVSRNDIYAGRFRFVGMLLIGVARPCQD